MRSRLGLVLEKKGNRIYSVQPEASVLEAVKLMNEHQIGALLVVTNGRPVGMFTERDVVVRVVGENRSAEETHVADVMTRDLAVVGPDTTVEEAMAICTQKRLRHLPVMQGNDLLGLISTGDLSHWMTEKQGTEIQELIRYIRGEYPG